jgi:predicted ATPase/DNA-binding SARP family transcriptional activator
MAGASAAVEFRVLAGVQALRDGEALKLGGPRQRALLALLLLADGRPVPADRLIDELWHGKPPPGAAGTLQSYVSRLRSALGANGAIAGNESGYHLDVDEQSVDARRFERLVDEGHAALERDAAQRALERFEAALALWTGTPFGDVGDEGLLRAEAGRLADVRHRAREGLVAAKLQLGSGEELIDELESLVAEHPYRERLWQHLMLALYRAERQADALAAYRRAREALDELGLKPGEELKQLEAAILRHEVPPVRPLEARHNLPSPLTSFVGREAELAEVDRVIADARLVTLTGVGGVGKTRLALEAARRALPDLPEGVCFIDFSPVEDAAFVARHVAAALEVREPRETTIEEMLVARLREAHLLLVLDNCEHLRRQIAELAHLLLTSCPRLRVLATSRETLGVPGEADYPVPPLALPPSGAGPDELRASEAVSLFLVRARETRPRLRDDGSALHSAAQICRDLDGLPLALELAAARAKALSLEEIASRLENRFRFLVSWRRLATARHRTLREAMDWSYDLLPQEEQALFARLSVFAGGFTLAAAAAVCLAGDEERAYELVEHLVEASLVTPEERIGRMRYRLLETVRQYASERLREDSPTMEEVVRAHGRFFATLVEHGDERSGDEAQGHVIDDDLENFRAAIESAARRADAETEVRLVGGLWRYWWVRGYLVEGRTRIDGALERRGDVRGRYFARALIGGGWLAMTQGDYERSRTLAMHGLAEARTYDGPVQEVAALNTLGVIAMRTREYDAARSHLRQSIEVAERHGLLDVLAGKLNIGLVELEAGRPEKAVPIFEDLLDLHGRNGELHLGFGFAAVNLGRALYRLDELERAQAAFEKARAAFEAIRFRAHYAHALQGLAAVESRIGSSVDAARLLGQAEAVLGDVAASEEDFEPGLVRTVESGLRSRLGDVRFAAAHAEGLRTAELTA